MATAETEQADRRISTPEGRAALDDGLGTIFTEEWKSSLADSIMEVVNTAIRLDRMIREPEQTS